MASDAETIIDRLRAQRKALVEFGLFAFQSDDLDAVLETASSHVSRALDVRLVKVLEHRPQRGEMLIRSGVNWQPGVVGHATFGDQEDSPGGYALKQAHPVVSPDVAQETRFKIPAVLQQHGVKSMVNVVIVGERRPFGVLEVDATDIKNFSDDDVAFLHTYANLLAAAIERVRYHEELRASARDERLLSRELAHRVKNVLAIVQALVSQTARRHGIAEEARASLDGRIRALAISETQVFQSESRVVDIRRFSEELLAPYQIDNPCPVSIIGPPVEIGARSARLLGLAIHELATNAVKYGALSVSEGSVRLEWQQDSTAQGDRLSIHWQETGGPEVRNPRAAGFGTRLLREIVPGELGGDAQLEYAPDGFRYRFSTLTHALGN